MNTIAIIVIVAILVVVVTVMETNNQERHEAIMSKLSDALGPIVTALEGLPAQLEKVKTEIINAIGQDNIPADALPQLEKLTTIANSLKAGLQALDDLNPDT